MSRPKEYTHVWVVFALPIVYLACSILLTLVAILFFVWTPAHPSVPRNISEPFWPHLLPVIGMVHPSSCAVQVWETLSELCKPVGLLHQDSDKGGETQQDNSVVLQILLLALGLSPSLFLFCFLAS